MTGREPTETHCPTTPTEGTPPMQPRSADHWTCADADEALLCRVWQGDEDALDALLNRYRSLVRTKAHSYFLVGGDREDVVQEGMIGLYKAIRDFDAAKQMTFRGFADLCVTRQIISAIKTATRQKHSPLNGYVSLHLPAYQDDEPEQELVDHVKAKGSFGSHGRRVWHPEDLVAALQWANREAERTRLPTLVEVTVEREASAAMGTSLDAINECEPLPETVTTGTDPHSYAEYERIRVKHLTLDLDADFSRSTLSGHAMLEI
jgi:RNA polymerase sigma-H factor